MKLKSGEGRGPRSELKAPEQARPLPSRLLPGS